MILQGFPPEVVFANRAMATILGYPITELTAISGEDIGNLIHPDDRKAMADRCGNQGVLSRRHAPVGDPLLRRLQPQDLDCLLAPVDHLQNRSRCRTWGTRIVGLRDAQPCTTDSGEHEQDAEDGAGDDSHLYGAFCQAGTLRVEYRRNVPAFIRRKCETSCRSDPSLTGYERV